MEKALKETKQTRVVKDPLKHPLAHRELRSGSWWQSLRGWRDVSEADFGNHRWQLSNSPTSPDALAAILGPRVSPSFMADLRRGFERAPMAMRVTPYIISLIDWDEPFADPIRRQFLPLGSEHEPSHPMATLDSLAEQRDAVAPGLTHRYPDKVLFLATDVCTVNCRYCTRSYSVGESTESVEKVDLRANETRYERVFAYLRDTPTVEDVVVSGGDTYLVSPTLLRRIGDRLLDLPNIRRIRFATKGPAVLPQKVLSDDAWFSAIADTAERGRRQGVQVCVHTHFNNPREITDVTQRALDRFFQAGVVVRNQSVLLRGVNDDAETMTLLLKRLAYVNVQPYYVYLHDLVPGVETLRTSLATGRAIEKAVRGRTAGFMTPTFVCDAFGGGGKRDLHSFELYDRESGIAVYRSPVVDPAKPFFYFDPLRTLSRSAQRAWRLPDARRKLIDQVLQRVRRPGGA